VGDVGQKLPALGLSRFQLLRHLVKGDGQLPDLVSAGRLHLLAQVSFGDASCCQSKPSHRRDKLTRQDRSDNQSQPSRAEGSKDYSAIHTREKLLR
jgi:hypothetical protein